MQENITVREVDQDAGIFAAQCGITSISYRDNPDSMRTALKGIDQALAVYQRQRIDPADWLALKSHVKARLLD